MIRRAHPSDADALARIYNQAMAPGVFATCDVDPVTAENRLEWLAQHAEPFPAFVLERDGEVRGWSALNPFSIRPSYRDTAEVSVYVDAAHRGRYVGIRLFAHLLREAERLGFKRLVSLTFEKNTPSLRGLEAAGFRRAACLREVAFLRGRWENVVWLELDVERGLSLERLE